MTVPRGLVALLVAATLWHVASFAWAMPNNDMIRDLLFALPIADGEAWPLRGPPINGAVHLGPLWFGVVALPLWLGAGLTTTALWLGALSALKVPVAWRLGARLGGAWLALAFAAAMLLPGWDRLHAIQLTHTVVFEALLLASLLPLSTLWRGGSARSWAAFGVLAGLAVHAHPLAAGLALPAAGVAWHRRAVRRRDLGWLAIGVALALLPLAPMLFAEWRDGWPMFEVARGKWQEASPGARTPLHELVPAFLLGAWTVPRVMTPSAYALAAGACTTLAIALAASGVPALLRDRRARRLAATVAVLVAVALVALVLVRYRTPFYMALVAWPGLMALVALPVAALAGTGARGRIAAGVAVVAMLAAGAITSIGWAANTRSGHASLPLATVIDIRHGDGPGVPLAFMPLHALDALASARCGGAVLHVHGELAALVDYYQRLPFRRHCPRMPVRLMGSGDGRHWAGMTPHSLARLGYAGAGWDEAIAFAPARVIAPARGIGIVEAFRYPARDVVEAPSVPRRVAFDAAADEAVAVYSPLFPYDASTAPVATCDGVAITPVSSTNAGALFLPPPGRPCRWEVIVESRAADHVDIVTLPLGPSPR